MALLADAAGSSAGRSSFALNPDEQRRLLEIARKSVEAIVKENKPYALPEDLPASLLQDRGAFVTIKKDGELRGCIGYTEPVKALASTVRDVAAHAALRDPRFPPVAVAELPKLRYEVSVLSPMRRVFDVNQIKVGTHGLMIVTSSARGLLLPQVAKEFGWDRNTLLDQTAIKAGLSADAWRDKDADLFMFTAVIFGE
jgi:AmmeMemoRadiSam system protein A